MRGRGGQEALPWRFFLSFNAPRALRDVLKETLRTDHLRNRLKYPRLFSAWAEAVGPNVADHARPTGLRRGVLTVEVDSPALMHELAGFERRRLLEAMQGAVKSACIEQIRFRLAGARRGR